MKLIEAELFDNFVAKKMNIGKITENRIFYICSSITQIRAFLVKKRHAEISNTFSRNYRGGWLSTTWLWERSGLSALGVYNHLSISLGRAVPVTVVSFMNMLQGTGIPVYSPVLYRYITFYSPVLYRYITFYSPVLYRYITSS